MAGIFFATVISGIAAADIYLETTCALISDQETTDTLSRAVNFVRLGERLPIFLPPYTIYCTISPLRDSLYIANLDFHELGPGFRFRQAGSNLTATDALIIDSLESKSFRYRYIFRLSIDSQADFTPFPEDSLSPRPSVHYETKLQPGSYADYKWPSRSALIEDYFDKYRKRLSITRAGKINLKVFSSAVENAALDHHSGIGIDIPGNTLFVVMNKEFDAAIPSDLQKFVIYETWGAGSRGLVVGMARYFLDDSYRLKNLISRLSTNELLTALKDETIATSETTEIICGAFCQFIISRFGIGVFKELYSKSAPGYLPIEAQFGKNESTLIDEFVKYIQTYRIDLNTAIMMANVYRQMMRFDLEEPLERYLIETLPEKKGFYLRRLAQTLFSQGRYEESIACYDKLGKSADTDGDWQTPAAVARLRAGQFEIALAALKKLINDGSMARKAIAEYYLDFGSPESAGVYLAQITSISDTWTAVLKARFAEYLGDKMRAESLAESGLRIAEAVITKIPGEARGYIDAGYCRLLKGDYRWAKADFEAALLVDDRPYYTAAALLGLGRLHERMEDKMQARNYYEMAAESNGGGYNRNLAQMLLRNLAANK